MKIKSVSNYMAMLRNLNNILKVDVSETHIEMICAALTDSLAVEKSKQYPYRFHSAYKTLNENKGSYNTSKYERIKGALNIALELSVANIPKIPGKSLGLIDVSGSMSWATISAKSKVTPAEIAGIFGAISSSICDDVDIVVFASQFGAVKFDTGEGVLKRMDKIARSNVGGGTEAYLPMEFARQKKVKYDRVILFSDMQCYAHDRSGMNSFAKSFFAYQREVSPAYLYTVDLTGYGTAQVPQYNDKVLMLSGFSEKLFEFIPKFESERATLVQDIEGYKV